MPTLLICFNKICRGETIGVFTLMIPKIANQKVRISSTSKTCDMSDIGARGMFAYLYNLLCLHSLLKLRTIRNEVSKKNCKRLNILFHTPAFQHMHIFFSFIKRNNYPGISSSSEHHIHEKSTNSASFVCVLAIAFVLSLAF